MKLVTDLPEIFESFSDARRQGFIDMKNVKDKGIPVVGVYCTFMPEEIIMAAGAVKVGLCSTSDETITEAEKDLPRNLCPLIKSSYGFAKTDKCPYFYFSDLVVGESTCDGKKKMYEYMQEFKPVYVMQLPNSKENESDYALWKNEVIRFKEKIEDFLHTEVTEENLKSAIKLKNKERQALKAFYELGKLNPPAVMGHDILKIVYGMGFKFDKENNIHTLNSLREEILERYEKGEKLEKRPRIIITGCPIGGAAEKVVKAVEEAGGIVVGFENCTGAKACDELVDENNPDLYDAIARKYLNIGCACISPNTSRFELLGRMIDEYEADGVVDMVLQACHPYAVESMKIKRFANNEKNVPCMMLETDYSQSDIEQINTRMAAFIEMLG